MILEAVLGEERLLDGDSHAWPNCVATAKILQRKDLPNKPPDGRKIPHELPAGPTTAVSCDVIAKKRFLATVLTSWGR